MNLNKSEGTNGNMDCTCSGVSGNCLFPIVNEIFGMVGTLLQLTNDFPTGFGSPSHSFHKGNFSEKTGIDNSQYLFYININSKLTNIPLNLINLYTFTN